jgi:hypothetical protein
MMATLGGQITIYVVLILCAKYVTSRRYSTAGVGGRMNALRSYDKLADCK